MRDCGYYSFFIYEIRTGRESFSVIAAPKAPTDLEYLSLGSSINGTTSYRVRWKPPMISMTPMGSQVSITYNVFWEIIGGRPALNQSENGGIFNRTSVSEFAKRSARLIFGEICVSIYVFPLFYKSTKFY